MRKNTAVVAPAAAGGMMGIFVFLLPDAWSFGQVMLVTIPVAIIVGMCTGRLAVHFMKK